MKNILYVKSSILSTNSKSAIYAEKLIEKIRNNDDNVLVRDVVDNPVTQLTTNALTDFKDKNSKIYKEYISLINELKNADTVVMAAPMYNFSISSQLHNYFDAIAQAGETFHYEKDGTQVGHLIGKKAYVVLSRGGIYKDNGVTFQEEYIKMFLNFIGITDIKFIFIEGVAIGKTIEQLNEEFEKQIN